MPIIQSTPRELLAVEYTVNATATNFSTNGAAFATPWSGTFQIGSRTNVEILCHVPYVTVSVVDWAGIVCLLDGAYLGVRFFWAWVGGMAHAGLYGLFRASGLAPGAHTVAINGRVGASGTTASYNMSATDKGLLVVREV